jgi:hypothetical protein
MKRGEMLDKALHWLVVDVGLLDAASSGCFLLKTLTHKN